MNILTDSFPETIKVHGVAYPAATSFRDCIQIMLAFEDDELTQWEKQIVMCKLLYLEQPSDTTEAIVQGIKFLNGSRAQSLIDEVSDPLRLYSFTHDAEFIFAAFKQTHGIDLDIAELHWWKFFALFMDLGNETTFCQLVSLRKRVYTGKATKEEREAAREMGDLFSLPEPDTRTLEEKRLEEQFMSLVKG